MKWYVLIILTIFCTTAKSQQLKSYNFNQLDSLQKVEQRKVFVFIGTNWCNYCQAMKMVVFKDSDVVKILNEQYYFVRLNAEDKSPIYFGNQRFTYNAYHSEHELVDLLARINGKISYPTICVLNKENELIFQYQQFILAKNLSIVLNQLANN